MKHITNYMRYPIELEFTEDEEKYFSAIEKREDPITADNVVDFIQEEFTNKDLSGYEDMDELLKEIESEIRYQFDDEKLTVLSEELDFDELTKLGLKLTARNRFRRAIKGKAKGKKEKELDIPDLNYDSLIVSHKKGCVVTVAHKDKIFPKVAIWFDSEQGEREYIVINNNVEYLDEVPRS